MEESDIRPGMIPQEGNCISAYVCHNNNNIICAVARIILLLLQREVQLTSNAVEPERFSTRDLVT